MRDGYAALSLSSRYDERYVTFCRRTMAATICHLAALGGEEHAACRPIAAAHHDHTSALAISLRCGWRCYYTPILEAERLDVFLPVLTPVANDGPAIHDGTADVARSDGAEEEPASSADKPSRRRLLGRTIARPATLARYPTGSKVFSIRGVAPAGRGGTGSLMSTSRPSEPRRPRRESPSRRVRPRRGPRPVEAVCPDSRASSGRLLEDPLAAAD